MEIKDGRAYRVKTGSTDFLQPVNQTDEQIAVNKRWLDLKASREGSYNNQTVQDGITQLNKLLADIPPLLDQLEEEVWFEQETTPYIRIDRMMVCIGQIRELLKIDP